jgi:hypothetical protein
MSLITRCGQRFWTPDLRANISASLRRTDSLIDGLLRNQFFYQDNRLYFTFPRELLANPENVLQVLERKWNLLIFSNSHRCISKSDRHPQINLSRWSSISRCDLQPQAGTIQISSRSVFGSAFAHLCGFDGMSRRFLHYDGGSSQLLSVVTPTSLGNIFSFRSFSPWGNLDLLHKLIFRSLFGEEVENTDYKHTGCLH